MCFFQGFRASRGHLRLERFVFQGFSSSRRGFGLEIGHRRRLVYCQEAKVELVTLDAGHNVHVDDLPGLLAALEPSFT